MNLKQKTVFITGASRGIGLAIALRLAREGANIAIAAKTATPHASLPGTIYTAAEEVEAAGGHALPLVCDIRDLAQIEAAVQATVDTFGGIDICINNASAIDLQPTTSLAAKQYDLINQINVRGTYMVSRACVPHLMRATNPHVLSMSPPPVLRPEWFAPYPAYALSKYSMTFYALAMAEEFREAGIAFNTLWPRTLIATSAMRRVANTEAALRQSRTPEIIADAAYYILRRSSREWTGQHFIDEDVLTGEGVEDLSRYRAVAGSGPLAADLFVEPIAARVDEIS